ncbi:hypothetical protein Pmar_PMAR012186 [Perkinsus marinus ATCC 50983]|uniref:Uncharacterized protein n=1 Tax=Perkinsus marinus (strain ATCC 50983 / TXsc) TaxID=423536 RepID=C5K864_PERM5|nr:hypothetical protein Pmar_PMAR012186 [Perkinsus marinus ATCC 50983]EER19334.1 hypothetical protein Pmar_PMAR012186 [Perkinsus marinus ATCC 50983]|eukprot:XP_002787538.1 hypothetical protein Pmar_PMAR012186 [Perkinsus marinus ATCC 50983]
MPLQTINIIKAQRYQGEPPPANGQQRGGQQHEARQQQQLPQQEQASNNEQQQAMAGIQQQLGQGGGQVSETNGGHTQLGPNANNLAARVAEEQMVEDEAAEDEGLGGLGTW